MVDSEIKDFYNNKENCLRRTMLQSIGDLSPMETTIVGCCRHCDASTKSFESHNPKLIIYNAYQGSKRRRIAAWNVTDSLERNLKDRLLQERRRYVQDHPAFLFLGEEAVCPDCVIEDICTESRFIKTKEDMSSIYGIHSELSDKFLNVILDVLSNSSASNKRRRKQ